jgi:hypothetical protein
MGTVTTGAGRGGAREKIEVTTELAKEVAQAIIDGETLNSVIKAVNLSAPTVKKIMRSPEFTEQIKGIVRNRVARLADKMVAVLEQQLNEGSLDAVKVGFKVLSVLDPEPVQTGSQTLTVVLPGASQPQKEVISTQFEVVDAVPETLEGDGQ